MKQIKQTNNLKQFKHEKKTEKLTPKSWGHNSVPPKHFHRFTINFESGDTIVYHHTNQHPTLLVYHVYILCIQWIVNHVPAGVQSEVIRLYQSF